MIVLKEGLAHDLTTLRESKTPFGIGEGWIMKRGLVQAIARESGSRPEVVAESFNPFLKLLEELARKAAADQEIMPCRDYPRGLRHGLTMQEKALAMEHLTLALMNPGLPSETRELNLDKVHMTHTGRAVTAGIFWGEIWNQPNAGTTRPRNEVLEVITHGLIDEQHPFSLLSQYSTKADGFSYYLSSQPYYQDKGQFVTNLVREVLPKSK